MPAFKVEAPAPLTPPDCDLRGLDHFKFYFRRLADSVWWTTASDVARSRNVDLWAHAMQEVPAASLPDDNGKLTMFAGFGRDIEAFKRAKDDILEAWVLCSDRRWYHPFLASVALDALKEVRAKADAREAERLKKASQRERKKGVSPGTSAVVPRDIEACPPGQIEKSGGRPQGQSPMSPGQTAKSPGTSAVVPRDIEACPPGQIARVRGDRILDISDRAVEASPPPGLSQGEALDLADRLGASERPKAETNELVLVGQSDKPSARLTKRPNSSPTPAELAEFEAWWVLYPRKVAKRDALVAFVRARRDGAPLDALNAGALALAREHAGRGDQFIPHAATWLNGRRWEDEPATHQDRPAPPRRGMQGYSALDQAIAGMEPFGDER